MKSIPEFSLEEELKSAAQFTLEPVVAANRKNPPKPQAVSREDLDAYEQSDLYQGLVDRARGFYVGDYWVKHFDVRLGEQLGR